METESVGAEQAEWGQEATEKVTVRITCRTVADLRKLARQHNRSFSGEVRQAVTLYVAQYKRRAGEANP